MVSLIGESPREQVHSAGVPRLEGRTISLLQPLQPARAPSVQNQTNDSWILIHSSALSFPLSCWEAKLQYFIILPLYCVFYLSLVVLPSFWHLFKKKRFCCSTCSYLLFVCLVKPPIAIMYLSQHLGRYPCCILAASFINLELKVEIPLTALIYMFSRCVCHFPESELLLLDKCCSRWPSLTNHRLNNRTPLDRIKVGCIKLLNRPEIREGNSAAVSHLLHTEHKLASGFPSLSFKGSSSLSRLLPCPHSVVQHPTHISCQWIN